MKAAAHLCLDRAYLTKLVSQGTLPQRPDGQFDLDSARRAYIEFLRTERKRSPKSEADSAFTQAKAELLQIKIAEKKRDLIPREEAAGDMEELIGLFLSGLGSMPIRCGGRDLAVRRSIENAVFDLRLS